MLSLYFIQLLHVLIVTFTEISFPYTFAGNGVFKDHLNTHTAPDIFLSFMDKTTYTYVVITNNVELM